MSPIVVGAPPPNQEDARLLVDMYDLDLLDGELAFVSSVSDWFDTKGFLTDRQREALETIRARAKAR